MIAYSLRQAVAMYFGCDIDDLSERRYQRMRTPCAVYSCDEDYFTATKGSRKPKSCDDNFMGCWKWERVSGHGLPEGWNIWRANRDGV